MPFKEPFILGPFSVDAEGRLSLARRDSSPGFSIQWRGRIIHARLLQRDPLDGRLHIKASLGRIPSTAASPDLRLACISMLQNILRALPSDWTARLLPDHQPQLEVETIVSLPITITTLVVELTLFLLLLGPYLDLMDQAGLDVLVVAGGSASNNASKSPHPLHA